MMRVRGRRAKFAAFVSHLLSPVGTPRAKNQVTPFAGESVRRRSAEPGRGARDQNNGNS